MATHLETLRLHQHDQAQPDYLIELDCRTRDYLQQSKMRRRDSTDGCEPKRTGFTKAHSMWTQQIPQWVLFILISYSLLKPAGAIPANHECFKTCLQLQKYSFSQTCPRNNRTCDWQCEADRKNCSGEEKYHCAQVKGSVAFKQICAKPKICLHGEEPIISLASNRSIIECLKCQDNYYNPTSAVSSSFSECHKQKNECTQKLHMKDCGLERYGVPWYKNSTSDGYCRCDARAGYAPLHDVTEYKDEYCFFAPIICAKSSCPSGMELSLNFSDCSPPCTMILKKHKLVFQINDQNEDLYCTQTQLIDYMCIPKCPDGLYRTELSDECVNNITLSSSPPIFVTTIMKPSTAPSTSPPPEPIPTEPAPKRSSNSAVIIVLCLIGGLLLIVGFIFIWRYRETLHKLCNSYCGCAKWRCWKRKSQYSQVSINDPTMSSLETYSSSPTCIENNNSTFSAPNTEEVNVSNNHPENSERTEVVNEFQNNGDNNISGNENQSDTSEDASSKNGRKKKVSRKKRTYKTTHNKHFRIKVEGNLIVHHSGSSSQVEQLGRSIEKTTDTLCSNHYESNYQEDSGSEDMEIDTTNIAPDVTENGGNLSPVQALLNNLKYLLIKKWTKVTEIACPAIRRKLQANAKVLCVNLEELMNLPKKLAQPAVNLLRDNSRNIPNGFIAYKTTGKNNSCLYQAISILLYGDESHHLHLRLCCAIHAVENMALYKNKFEEHFQSFEDKDATFLRVQQVFTCYGVQVNGNREETYSNWKDLLDVLLFKLLVEICDKNSDSSQLHVRMLGNAIGCEMIEHFESMTDPNPCKDLHLENIHQLNGHHRTLKLTIYWCRFTQGSIGEINHILPLLPEAACLGSEALPIAKDHFESYPATKKVSQSQGSNTDNFDNSGSLNNVATNTKEYNGNNGNDITENSGSSCELLRKTTVIDGGDSGVCSAATNEDVSSTSSASDSETNFSAEETKADVVQEAISASRHRKNVGDAVDIKTYAGKEWGLNNTTAYVFREAYACVKHNYKLPYIRVIRGDNYCAIRSIVFQILVYCFPPVKDLQSCETALSAIGNFFRNRMLSDFKFEDSKASRSKNRILLVKICLQEYYEMGQKLATIPTNSDRQQILAEALNCDSDCDLNIMEAVKLFMAYSAVNLHRDIEQGKEVPEWALQLFARDGSTTVGQFISNHLNKVGRDYGLEQVEVCLLGYSLGVCIRVLRLSHLNKADFEVFYPLEGKDAWPVVTIISEDDRHYNIPVE